MAFLQLKQSCGIKPRAFPDLCCRAIPKLKSKSGGLETETLGWAKVTFAPKRKLALQNIQNQLCNHCSTFTFCGPTTAASLLPKHFINTINHTANSTIVYGTATKKWTPGGSNLLINTDRLELISQI